MEISYTYKGKRVVRTGPDTWEQMSAQQYIATIRAINIIEQEPEKTWALPVILLGIPLREYFGMSMAQRHVLIGYFHHLSEFNDLPKDWMLPSIQVGWHKWYGPNKRLTDLIFAEFMFAESMLERYYSKHDEWELDRFIAILYRPKSWFGKRHDFNNKLVDERAKQLIKLDKATKMAILLNYQGWKKHLKKLYKYAFQEAKQGEKAQKSNWLEQATRLAEHRQSELTAIKNTSFYEVMSNINLRIKDFEWAKSQLPQNNK